jgi:hypothetical protein
LHHGNRGEGKDHHAETDKSENSARPFESSMVQDWEIVVLAGRRLQFVQESRQRLRCDALRAPQLNQRLRQSIGPAVGAGPNIEQILAQQFLHAGYALATVAFGRHLVDFDGKLGSPSAVPGVRRDKALSGSSAGANLRIEYGGNKNTADPLFLWQRRVSVDHP